MEGTEYSLKSLLRSLFVIMDEEIKVNFESVCSELNIDEEARDKAWAEYQTINNDYVLEVDG